MTFREPTELPLTLPLRRSSPSGVAPTYANRANEQVQVIGDYLKCGLVEVWVLTRQVAYYVSKDGRHRSLRSLDIVCDWDRRGELPREEWWFSRKKKKEKVHSSHHSTDDQWVTITDRNGVVRGWVKTQRKKVPPPDIQEIVD